MAEKLGRKITISIDGDTQATARTKSFTINNSPVNITSDGDDGIQRLLDEPGEKAIEITVDGVADINPATGTTALKDKALTNSLLSALILDYGDYTLNGNFFQSSYAENGTYNDAMSFSASYSSSGVVTKTLTP